jgi:hypothetical protein
MEKCSCAKTGSAQQTPQQRNDYALKLAEACEFIAQNLDKLSADAPLSPGHGPGALDVTESIGGTNVSPDQGHATQQPPMRPASQKGVPASDPATGLQDNATGLPTEQQRSMDQPKTGSVKTAEALLKTNLARLGLTKTAEDAINPAKISAGPAGAPPGDEPTPAQPQETERQSKMVASNQAAVDYTKGQAKSVPKDRLREVLKEPALSAATDSTLRQAFANTSKAGVKISSADSQVKVAAARALLTKLAEDGAKEDASPEQKEKREKMLSTLREKKDGTEKDSNALMGYGSMAGGTGA